MKFKLFSLASVCCAALTACGGGGDGPVTSGTSLVSTPFTASAKARVFLVGPNTQKAETLTSFTQSEAGIMTKLNDSVLGTVMVDGKATVAAKDVTGDANYTMGRWTTGVINTAAGATTSDDGKGSLHYLAFKSPDALPTPRTVTCMDATYTTATSQGDGDPKNETIGAVSGTAAIDFSASAASVTGYITVGANGKSGTVKLDTVITDVNAVSYPAAGGAMVALGRYGSGTTVTAGYSVKVANGTTYKGVAVFRCS